ncbi:hydroxyurea phosphotransferase [Actinorhabdospora filicis]|uniref:Hydroxyurea phosphotransferase n=1 Tax=Actinorhabdospora filicis TaxID=1785913 RepID=A0A9W6WAU7_9ACTN|nr:aminoglycoside phosphotransferase family protein [Actinorhabdospora filicis]GLZ78951.1 hydroxyurea phosphotransferase [Actinorhabdospora filicis]
MLTIPTALLDTRGRDEEGRSWLASLPALHERYLAEWDLRPAEGHVEGGIASFLQPVRRADGTRAYLKFQPVDEENIGEAIGLRAWDGRDSVRLLDEDPATGVLLLEALDATRPLSKLADSGAAAEVIGGLLASLTAHKAPEGLRTLADIAAQMLADVPKTLAAMADEDEKALLRTCADAVAELVGEPGDRLLHWDLHYDNVLAPLPGTGRGEWLAIDPKPLAGDPGFDILPALHNRWSEITGAGDPAKALLRRFDAITGALAIDRDRAAGWTLGRVLQNSLWTVEDGEDRLEEPQMLIARVLLAR